MLFPSAIESKTENTETLESGTQQALRRCGAVENACATRCLTGSQPPSQVRRTTRGHGLSIPQVAPDAGER